MRGIPRTVAIAASTLLVAACGNAEDGETIAEEEAVPLADACPDQVADMRGSTAPLTCSCTPEAAATGSVWGSGPYTDDSNVCRAALHAGLIEDEPVNVTVNFLPGRSTYTGSEVNGVVSNDYGPWSGSFGFEGVAFVEAPDTVCPRNARQYRGQSAPVTCECSAELAGGEGTAWGSGPYTDDSNICRAAVHAGIIPADGGEVTFRMLPGQASYEGSTSNNVRTANWGEWESSFDFVETEAE